MPRISRILFAAISVAAFLLMPVRQVRAQSAVVRAVLFYSPTCGHCHYVITEILPPLFEQYGDQLQVLGVDVTTPEGQVLFRNVLQNFNLESGGVPFLVVGDIYLVGSVDIPQKFPGLIQQYLSRGGVDWPNIPGLAEVQKSAQNAQPPDATPTPVPVVQAVLFYRSSCEHCMDLMKNALPPLIEKYGSQLQIFGIDVSQPDGDAVYTAAIDYYEVNPIGVPMLIVGDRILFGVEIDQQFPGIIEDDLRQGGTDLPDIPGLAQTLADAQASATATMSAHTTNVAPAVVPDSSQEAGLTPTPGLLLSEDSPGGLKARFSRDLAGNSLSVIILLGMIAAIIWGVVQFSHPKRSVPDFPKWVIPALCLIGLGVAAYLAYVEITSVKAVCGPVGDCNTVQQSKYARLFGILPIGVLGMAGYVLLILTWWVDQVSKGVLSLYARLASLGMTVFGTLFSIYLTFLEPFVIGATCAWCLTSALVMTGLFILSLQSGRQAFFALVHPPRRRRKR